MRPTSGARYTRTARSRQTRTHSEVSRISRYQNAKLQKGPVCTGNLFTCSVLESKFGGKPLNRLLNSFCGFLRLHLRSLVLIGEIGPTMFNCSLPIAFHRLAVTTERAESLLSERAG